MSHPNNQIQTDTPVLRLRDVIAKTKLKKSTIYSKIKAKTFPASICVGGLAYWSSDAIDHWIKANILDHCDSAN
jgi:prophage regulatory protein